MHAICHQRDTDQQNERQRQHLHRWVPVDELPDGARTDQHQDNREHVGQDHDRQHVRHTNRRDYGIERKDEINHHDHHDHPGKRRGIGLLRPFFTAFDLLVDLRCPLPQ